MQEQLTLLGRKITWSCSADRCGSQISGANSCLWYNEAHQYWVTSVITHQLLNISWAGQPINCTMSIHWPG